jgi:REP element-mobilizing transposase RayT
MSAFIHVRIHFVWSTNGREPSIRPEWRDNLYAYMSGICENSGSKMLIAGGMPDHIHLYVSLDANHSIASMVNLLKSNSSRWVHENYDRRFQWQTKYAAFSVSTSAEDTLFQYIRNQEEHHRVRSFSEELMLLLQKHGMDYDPRYLLE